MSDDESPRLRRARGETEGGAGSPLMRANGDVYTDDGEGGIVLFGGKNTNPTVRKRAWIVAFIVVIVLIVGLGVGVMLGVHGSGETHAPQVSGKNGAVAADHPLCSQVGVDILTAGGNAVDAAVATGLCQGVLNSFASGIGGGGVMVIHWDNGTDVVLDFREKAPAAATEEMFNEDPMKAQTGPLAVAVPGELKGLETAHRMFGRLPWKTVVQPAADYATNGFPVGKYMAKQLREKEDIILNEPSLGAVLAPGGAILEEGDIAVFAKLGETLYTIGEQGADVFYDGPLGEAFVDDLAALGGIMTMDDVRNYTVAQRPIVSTYYHGYKVLTAGPPYSGLCLCMGLNIVERFLFSEMTDTSLEQHLIVEAFKFMYADRMALGDPDFVNLDGIIEPMLSKDHAAMLRERISNNRTYPPGHYQDLHDLVEVVRNHGTTHLSVVDSERNSVAFTSTINLTWGAKLVSESTGIFCNDEMDDFSIPTASNYFGVPPSPANFIRPGKRPLSSMAPVVVTRDDKTYLVTGGSGGTKITTAVMQTVINTIDHGMAPEYSVGKARLHDQLFPLETKIEWHFSDRIGRALENMGHNVTRLEHDDFLAIVQAILIDPDSEMLLAASDSRKFGQPAAF